MWIELRKRFTAYNASLLSRVRAFRAAHIAGLFCVLLSLIVYDAGSTGAVGYMSTFGIPPRGYAIVMALCGAFLLASPRSPYRLIAMSPFLYYCMMRGLYTFSLPLADQDFIPFLVDAFLYVAFTYSLAHDEGTVWPQPLPNSR